jgi:FkbM family methyltransferase
MKYISKTIHSIIRLFFKKNILLVPLLGSPYMNATKSKLGFWYCGNLFNTSDIAYGIARNGEVESEETELVQNILKQLPSNYTLLDIGANTGYYGIMSAYMSPQSKTYSFEPLNQHCDYIIESSKLNKLSNIDIIEYALGETNEKKDIYPVGSGTSFIKDFTKHGKNKINIEIKVLDDVVKEKKIDNIHFVKIDVEGFEFEVLKGAKNTIESFKPIIFTEICQNKDGRQGTYTNPNFKKTIEYIEQFGYITQILEYGTLKKFDKNTNPPRGVFMFLFTHIDKHSHIII